ncbi:hypothetical protein AVEN_121620-1 [Araneus ventricosus]|uniref:Uncharacterized protein n=1 Tax=Araneus ventricosus TaxID=182803 RepID=A0A4Y2N4K7_ARAVE|nr:hypothetical protein AVEN_121620-1 [Araneus ventricosus]
MKTKVIAERSINTVTEPAEEEERESKFLREIHPLIVAFLLVGLDFRPVEQSTYKPDKKNRNREVAIRIAVVVSHILCFLYIVQFAYEIFVDGTKLSVKLGLANSALRILVILLKYLLHHRQKTIAKMLTHISKEYDKSTDKQKHLNKKVLSIAIALNFGVIIVEYTLVFLESIDGNARSFRDYIWERFQKIFPRIMPTYIYCFLSILDFVWFVAVGMVMIQLQILLVVICMALTHILKDYGKALNSPMATLDELLERHTQAMSTIKKTDECLSLPLFIILGEHVSLLFFIISFIFSHDKGYLTGLDIYFYTIFIAYTLQYFGVTMFASMIHREVQNITIKAGEMHSFNTRLSIPERILLMLKISGSSNTCLTVCSVNITRSLVFSSFGVLVTYGVLFRDL